MQTLALTTLWRTGSKGPREKLRDSRNTEVVNILGLETELMGFGMGVRREEETSMMTPEFPGLGIWESRGGIC